MDVLGPTDEPNRAHAEPMGVEGFFGRLNKSGMIG